MDTHFCGCRSTDKKKGVELCFYFSPGADPEVGGWWVEILVATPLLHTF